MLTKKLTINTADKSFRTKDESAEMFNKKMELKRQKYSLTREYEQAKQDGDEAGMRMIQEELANVLKDISIIENTKDAEEVRRTIYFTIVRKPYTYPLQMKRPDSTVEEVLKEFPDAKILNADAEEVLMSNVEGKIDVRDIEADTIANNAFRKVISTGGHLQLVLMSLLPNEDIGMEVHQDVDQFFRIEEGEGELDTQEYGIYPLKAGSSVLIKAGIHHNILNVSSNEPLKLYTIYGPPNHGADILQNTKQEAVLAEEEGTDKPPTETGDADLSGGLNEAIRLWIEATREINSSKKNVIIRSAEEMVKKTIEGSINFSDPDKAFAELEKIQSGNPMVQSIVNKYMDRLRQAISIRARTSRISDRWK